MFASAISSPHLSAGSSTGILVPLYSPPGDDWNTLVQARNANPAVPITVIINPENGPGTFQDASFVQGIQQLHSAGIAVVGYVATSYAWRTTDAVIADINSYKNWYTLDGVFFDEMSMAAGNENYYSILSSYAKSMGLTLTIGNPGVYPPSSFLATVDVLVIYEAQGLPGVLDLSSLILGASKTKFALIAYGVGSLDSAFVRIASNDVGYMYITDANAPNPYASLPSYFSTLVAVLNPTIATFPLIVKSVNLTGAPIRGLWTTIQSNDNTIGSGYTPLNFTAINGTTYNVSVYDYGPYTFKHWDDGSTNKVRRVFVTQGTTLTAYYQVAAGYFQINITGQKPGNYPTLTPTYSYTIAPGVILLAFVTASSALLLRKPKGKSI